MILYIILTSCTSVPKSSSNQPTSGLLFPQGNYIQDVELKIEVSDKNIHESINFKAAIKKETSHFVMLAYNTFGFSLFRIEEFASLPLQWSSDVEMINKNKTFFLQMYPTIRKIFDLKGIELKESNGSFLWKSPDSRFEVHFVNFDNSGNPIKIEMSDQQHFWLKIQNSIVTKPSK